MKNSILAIFALAAIVSCKKTETTIVDNNEDSMGMMAPTDTDMMVNDSLNMTTEMAADMSVQDKTFADAAATGGMMEVKLGEYAAANAMHADVKALGNMMATDHGKANDELKGWATTVGYTLPTEMTAEQKKMTDDLMKKKGADFDKAYADMMVKDHKKDIAAFKKEGSEGSMNSLKSFADKTVPTLEMHLMKSEEALKMVK